MDARLSTEHEQIQETATNVLEANDGIELARRFIDGDDTVIDDVWDEITDLDFTAITVPPEHNGFGEGQLYLTALLETLGRYAMPGPFPETMAFAVPLIANHGTPEQQNTELTAIANGTRRVSFAIYDSGHQDLPHAIDMTADPVDDGYELTGTKTLVPYPTHVDRVIVAARTQNSTGYNGLTLFLIDPSTVDSTTLDSLDKTRPVGELTFENYHVDDAAVIGTRHAGGEPLQHAIDRYNLAIAAMLTGAADRAVELSATYGKERYQYGQPIGRFQAVKHRIADMWTTTEQARSLTYYAAWALDNDQSDASQAITTLKTYAGTRLHDVFAADIKNHGGMGFTWDHDTHIYLKQAKAWENYLGPRETQLDRLADTRNYSTDTLDDYPELTTDPFN
jgi:alkylation response protein AidB-like acyl-CoA dehydrogenase